jgi:tetratricopeptide (TPR) repeat protein
MFPCRNRPVDRLSHLENSRNQMRVGGVNIRILIVLVILLGLGTWYVWATVSVDTAPVVTIEKSMKEAFEKEKYAETETLARRLLAKDPKSTVGSLYAGQTLIKQGRPMEALDFLQQVVDSESPEAAYCHLLAGQILCNQLSQFREAEKQFRRALHLQPHLMPAYELMQYVLRLGSRSWELIPFELREIEQKQMSIESMELLSRNERVPPELSVVLKGIRENPEDPNVLLGHAHLLRAQQKYGEAEALLRKAVQVAPEIDESHVRLGQILLEQGKDADFLRWQAEVKDPVKQHPMYWSLMARRAQNVGETEVAARCYWETLKLDPNQLEANYQLGQLLLAMGRKEDAKAFLERELKLVDYMELVRRNKVRSIELGGKGDTDLASQAIKASDGLGNLWEFYGWVMMTLELDKGNVALQQEQTQIESALKNQEYRRTLAGAYPTAKVDLAKLPLPKWNAGASSSNPRPTATPVQVTFEDQAKAAGVSFQFVDGSDPQVHGLNKMFQINGGGTGVLDFDRDGWPDLYFTQGSNDPQDHEQTEHLDRLFRNLGNGHFADVTAQAGLVENGYSQGVAIGDINNDGFPDIFVGNIGSNRLFLNNGDGTFSDATEESGVGDSTWTSSCVIADLDGDSRPDIFSLGFVQGDAMTRICNNQKKRLDACMPIEFPMAKSHLWLNRGDGRFEDGTAASGVDHPNGKGTALIAADLDGSGKLALLVGNDANPNFLFKNSAVKRGDRPKFYDQALFTGIAMGYDGTPRACLGLAAGDFNGDGLLDFHGTSLSEEPDTLYLQRPHGLFDDVSRAAGLFEPTYLKASYGTQAIDGTLDGHLDLFTANGNVDDIISEYLPYEMPPSYLKNDGKAHFSPVAEETLGPYFKGKYLGRSISRLDWNRDGREDVVISNVRSPAALLTNTTPHVGHHLTVRLVSTASARDSIGTRVELTAAGKKLVRQLTAGDGFQASNERILVFGLGDKTSADSIDINWISGRHQRLSKVPADQEILVVEGRTEPVVLRRN